MMFLENLRLAFSSLKANKMRALLTMLGIIIGISSVIAIMTVGNSLTESVTGEMSAMGANNITVYLTGKEVSDEVTDEGLVFQTTAPNYSYASESDLISKDMIENLCETYPDDIYAISADESVGSGQVIDGKKHADIKLLGASTGYFAANDVEMTDGRYFSKAEMDNAKLVCIGSDKLVEKMFGGNVDEALGSILTVSVNGKEYQITLVGLYKYEQSVYDLAMGGKNISTSLYIPLRTAKQLTHNEYYQSFTIVTANGVDSDEFAATTKSFFKTYYKNNRFFDVDAMSMASLVDSMNNMMDKITLAIAIVAGIALLVGGIGVMNIMLVSITERTREIGTRKALGAPNASIRMQFIIEAVVICIIGGLIGITLGVTAGMLLAKALGTPAVPSLSSIAISLSFSMAIGVFFGYYPANKAAKMDPIEALRYE